MTMSCKGILRNSHKKIDDCPTEVNACRVTNGMRLGKPGLLTRRAFGGGLAAMLPSVALAHSGHGATRILADVQSTRVAQETLFASLTLTNLGNADVTLLGILAEGAKGSIDKLMIAPSETRTANAELAFSSAIPNIFTAFLDFGEDALGPVLVMPNFE